MVWPAIAFAAGIAVASWTPPGLAWLGGAAAVLVCAGLVAAARLVAATAWLVVAVSALGALRAMPLPLPPDHVGRLPLPVSATVEGRLAGEPRALGPDRARAQLDVERVEGEARSGRVQITIHGELPPLVDGQRVRAPLRLDRPLGFHNPDGPDHAARLRREGIHAVAGVRADRLLLLDDPGRAWSARTRQAATDSIARALPEVSAALLAGLLLGDRSQLPEDVDEQFRVAGVYHVLAVSGFNVGLVAGAVFALLGFVRGGRRLAALAAGIAVVGFALIVGPEPSVLRAVAMAVLVLGAVLLDREASVVNSLALAALVILAVRPHDLLDPGFQLSFAATLGIVVAPMPRGLVAGALAVSLAAQLAVTPIALLHFNQLSTLAPVVNLAIVPLAAACTMLGLVGVALSPVTTAGATAFLDAAWPLLLAMRGVVALAAAVPGALLHLPAPPWTAIAAYAAGLALALTWWRWRPHAADRARRAGAAALVLVGAAAAIEAWPYLRPPDGLLRVAVLDVGQGDAIVIQTPGGEMVLVDAGPGGPMRIDAGERVVAPFLWNRGVLGLAVAATTHGDTDHAGGMPFVLRHFEAAERWTPATRPAEPRWIGGVRLEALAATAPLGAARGRTAGRTRAVNEEGLVLRVDHGAVSFLLAADVGAATEAALLAGRAAVGATVLKVAHHGSRGSTTPEFLQAVRPRIAVISVGARNAYGHPAGSTLDRLTAAGARVYRTDRDGAILFETDGAALAVTRWATRQRERYCLDPGGLCCSSL
jgi:competence protein ComEC